MKTSNDRNMFGSFVTRPRQITLTDDAVARLRAYAGRHGMIRAGRPNLSAAIMALAQLINVDGEIYVFDRVHADKVELTR